MRKRAREFMMMYTPCVAPGAFVGSLVGIPVVVEGVGNGVGRGAGDVLHCGSNVEWNVLFAEHAVEARLMLMHSDVDVQKPHIAIAVHTRQSLL